MTLVPYSGNFGRIPGVFNHMQLARLSEAMLDAFGASIAGLFLLLAVCFAVPAGSQGIWFELFHVAPPPPCCVDGGNVVVQIEPSGEATVNGKPGDAAQTVGLVAAKMEQRAERGVYLTAEGGTTVQEVAGLAGNLASTTEGLHIGLMTQKQLIAIRHQFGGQVIFDLDQLVWPKCLGAIVSDQIPILGGCR